VQSGVFALVVVDVHFDFLGQAKLSAVGKFQAFRIGGKNVVGFACRNALGELARVVGVLIPADFVGLVGSAANFHSDAVDGAIVGPPDRAEDEGVRLVRFLRSGMQNSWNERKQDDTE
jgi:hypothetical protein